MRLPDKHDSRKFHVTCILNFNSVPVVPLELFLNLNYANLTLSEFLQVSFHSQQTFSKFLLTTFPMNVKKCQTVDWGKKESNTFLKTVKMSKCLSFPGQRNLNKCYFLLFQKPQLQMYKRLMVSPIINNTAVSNDFNAWHKVQHITCVAFLLTLSKILPKRIFDDA